MTTVPYDPDAEHLVVGGRLAFPAKIDDALDALDPSDFHDQRCAKVFAAIASLHADGHRIDTHAAHVESGVDLPDVLDLQLQSVGSPTRYHIDTVLRHSTARRLMAIGSGLTTEAAAGTDPYELTDRATDDLQRIDTPRRGAVESMTMESILSTSDTLSPWVIPDMMRSDWRAIIVAGEGAGKSTLLRQIAICSSQGIDPLRFHVIMPIRVLMVDLENPVEAIKETGARIVRAVVNKNGGYDDEALRVWMRPGGIDVRTRRDRLALEREVAAHRPDLVIMGPVYKLSQRQPRESYEEATDPVLHILDDLRTRYGFALILEHHAPQANQGAREMRPFGSQRWMAWPELGLGLKKFRGDRLLNKWPNQLHRGQVWPWVGRWDEDPGAAPPDRTPPPDEPF